jgi:uncharacterized protein (DUF2141 family)
MSLVTAALLSASLLAQQPPRDAPASRAKPSTASITGVVVSDDPDARPLRRATVTLSRLTGGASQSVATADDGTFVFGSLEAGRYAVKALKDAYVPTAYGATRPNGPGTGITLRDGENASVTIRLSRGAVITGIVTDEQGQPAPDILVQAFTRELDPHTGERRLRPQGLGASRSNISDDRGLYRIYGLPAGEYVIGTVVSSPTPNPLQQSSAEDVRAALAQVKGQSLDGQTAGTSRNVTPVPVYYPGTTSAARAEGVVVRQGEERSGIDLRAQYATAATISGTVANLAEGAHAAVTLERKGENLLGVRRTNHVVGEGRFIHPNIEPGSYVLLATSLVEARPGGAPLRQFAMAEVDVDGQDVDGVILTLQPALRLAGRFEFEGTPPAADALPRSARAPQMYLGGSMPIQPSPLEIEDGWRFRIDGLVPGLLTPATILPGVRAPLGRWWVKSAVANGRDLLDAPLELRESLSEVVVTLTERPSELAGTVIDNRGNPAARTWVVAFSTAPQFWFVHSRRVAAVQADASGRYSLRNLPPGNYLVAASDDLERNEWFDSSVLERLASRATRIAIGERDTKTVDLVAVSGYR